MNIITLGMILGFAMSITNIFKKCLQPVYVPFAALGIALLLHVGYTAVYIGYSPDILLKAGAEMFALAGAELGLFVVGDLIRKSDKTPFKIERKPE